MAVAVGFPGRWMGLAADPDATLIILVVANSADGSGNAEPEQRLESFPNHVIEPDDDAFDNRIQGALDREPGQQHLAVQVVGEGLGYTLACVRQERVEGARREDVCIPGHDRRARRAHVAGGEGVGQEVLAKGLGKLRLLPLRVVVVNSRQNCGYQRRFVVRAPGLHAGAGEGSTALLFFSCGLAATTDPISPSFKRCAPTPAAPDVSDRDARRKHLQSVAWRRPRTASQPPSVSRRISTRQAGVPAPRTHRRSGVSLWRCAGQSRFEQGCRPVPRGRIPFSRGQVLAGGSTIGIERPRIGAAIEQ